MFRAKEKKSPLRGTGAIAARSGAISWLSAAHL
jgi:hypothetical protein